MKIDKPRAVGKGPFFPYLSFHLSMQNLFHPTVYKSALYLLLWVLSCTIHYWNGQRIYFGYPESPFRALDQQHPKYNRSVRPPWRYRGFFGPRNVPLSLNQAIKALHCFITYRRHLLQISHGQPQFRLGCYHPDAAILPVIHSNCDKEDHDAHKKRRTYSHWVCVRILQFQRILRHL